MGYTTVKDRSGSVAAAAQMAELPPAGEGWSAAMPLLADQVMAEAGVHEPRIAATALEQAGGDIARAVSLIRPWSSVLPRFGTARVDSSELEANRRITPAFAEPPGGQYLGASLDYAQRLLRLRPATAASNGHGSKPPAAKAGAAPVLSKFPSPTAAVEAEGLIAEPNPPAEAVDITRTTADRTHRGALLQLLSRAETGALTSLAYTAIRGFGAMQDPTLVELRTGTVPVRARRPDEAEFEVGRVALTTAQLVLYRMHGGEPDARFTLGFGATFGRLERRAISASLLDGACARAASYPPGARKEPCEDAEFLSIALDGQEATGFVEHLKLPHHVTFTSDLDRLRTARAATEAAE